jgi:ABC-type transport system involved in multi-copper enzyme maturation permease subunit
LHLPIAIQPGLAAAPRSTIMATFIADTAVPGPARDIDPATAVTNRLDTRNLEVTFPRVVRSEWVKFRSLRSNWLTLLATVVGIVAFGAIYAAVFTPEDDNDLFSNPITVPLTGYVLAQIIIAIVGVLAFSNEFVNGMIRTTFTAVPKRLPVLGAKALVVAGVTAALTVPTMIGTFVLGQALISGNNASLTDDGVLRVVLGSAGYLTAVVLLGLGLGAIVRQAASAIGIIVLLLFLAPQLAGFLLPASAQETLLKYLPSNAGEAITTVDPGATLLSPLMGAVVLTGWVIGTLGIAAVLLKRRDA